MDPRLFEAYYFYGRACIQEGKVETAARLFESALLVKPDDYQAPAFIGMAYSGLGRRDEAMEAYRRCWQLAEKHLELHPDDARALYLGACALGRLGERTRRLPRLWTERSLDLLA